MAKNIKKCLPFPEWALNSRAYISFSSLSEEGEPKDEKPFSAICFFSGNRKRLIDKSGVEKTTSGTFVFKGDIAPGKSDEEISAGTIEFYKTSYEICAVQRPRNPDGSIHHTEIEVF